MLLRVLGLVIRVRIALSVLPFKTVRKRLAARLASPATVPTICPTNEHVMRRVRAVHTASRFVPQASCLTQAIALQILLHENGIATDLRIGVARGTIVNGTVPNGFRAHAWLDWNGTTIIGGEVAGEFTPLPLSPGR